MQKEKKKKEVQDSANPDDYAKKIRMFALMFIVVLLLFVYFLFDTMAKRGVVGDFWILMNVK